MDTASAQTNFERFKGVLIQVQRGDDGFEQIRICSLVDRIGVMVVE